MGSVVISAASSGSGKTMVVCGLLKALKDMKINVSACKVGPDYIDTMFHTKALGVSSKNIDSFFCGGELLKKLYLRHISGSEITVIEGVMGFYDGLSMESASASTYETAKCINAPVIIVINAKGMALTVCALIKGLMEYKADSNIKGVILNNVSKGAYDLLKSVIERECGLEVVGFMPYIPECAVESRHLGLMTPNEIQGLKLKIERLGIAAQKYIDINRIIEISKLAAEININNEDEPKALKKINLAVALDEAFCFYYKDNLELLERLGCNIVYFSPLRDKKIPENTDGIILGGGYPELYCQKLSQNISMLKDIKDKLMSGLPCLAECGGFMYLHNTIEDINKKEYSMVGFINARAFKCESLVRFGYAELSAQKESFILKKGEKIKAHEFHYWDSTLNGSFFRAQKPSGKKIWDCINVYKNTVCGFPHIYYYSNEAFAKNFVKKCIEYKGIEK